jgi:hypothetical protein
LLLNTKIKAFLYGGGGYHKLHKYFQKNGITHRISCPHTQQQNGIAERKHKHETSLALLAQSSVPLCFWDEAFLTACYLINRLPSRVIDNNTPLARLLKTQPNYTLL